MIFWITKTHTKPKRSESASDRETPTHTEARAPAPETTKIYLSLDANANLGERLFFAVANTHAATNTPKHRNNSVRNNTPLGSLDL